MSFTTSLSSDVSGVELLMNNHQSLKAEIDARGDNFSACIALGKELLSRGHYATNEVRGCHALMFVDFHSKFLCVIISDQRETSSPHQPTQFHAAPMGGTLGTPPAQYV